MRLMTRVLSGIQPTGDLHLGNFVGAVRHWASDQHQHDSYYCIVDLHALTLEQDPAELRAKTLQVGALLLAAGLDPDVCTIFVQSHVPAHPQLSWLLECVASFGELRRMTQFKDKTAKGGEGAARAGLFTYPVLMAADILLYHADRVPVGDDQRQHLELARDIGERFNSRYGEIFTIPQAAIPKVGARVMDLQDPTIKMSKSRSSPQGKVSLLDPPEVITRKIKRAVTDVDSEVRYDPKAKPGVSNLLELLAVATDSTPKELAAKYDQYGPLKNDAAAAVVEFLRPLQTAYADIIADPAGVTKVLAAGADKAESVANPTLAAAALAMGLLPRS
ncbi:MAG: tryptophanyl-tRNA synthetase [Actinomycetota bacterium]|jgi:tryptophanyl-tRNA synthetase|nr:tryptophanyl-tRNA synthetase [Actinomycetota bacterium]